LEIEGLFSGGKWSLIKHISKKELSPLQLSEIMQTSVANVSQQLKLLELIGLVQTRKLPNRERGKPRTLYSISHDHIFIISALKNFAKKSFIKATPVQSAISRILCYDDINMHYSLMKLFWHLESQLEGISAMYFDKNSNVMVVATPKPSSIKVTAVNFKNSPKISVKVVADFKSKVLSVSQYPIYDPNQQLEVLE